MWNYQLYINGKWTDGQGADETRVINPATEAEIGKVPAGSVADAKDAIAAARRAFDEGPWPYMKPSERGARLKRMVEVLESKHVELRKLIQAETGVAGPILDMIQCGGAIGIGHYNAEEAQRLVNWVEASPPTGGAQDMAGSALVREPVGVVAAITAFNFPFMLNMVKAFPAMAVGCSVVLKPHSWTPLDAFEIAKAAEEAEIPPGVFNVITGDAEVGDELTGNKGVDMITFTGSTATGRRIMARAAAQIKRVELELGGKSAQILLDDVPETVAHGVGFGMALVHCGQGCALTTRLLMPEALMDAYLAGVEATKGQIVIGDPATDERVNLGPLVREQQRTRVHAYVESGIEQGARLVTGGNKTSHNGKGFFYEPTVFIGDNQMRIAREEIFGPVLTVIPYSGKEDDAIRIANDSIYGLSGSVMAGRTARAFNVARRIRTGTVTATGVGQPSDGEAGAGAGQGPGWGEPLRGIAQGGAFGGFKQSGLGREWGRHGLEAFTEIKSISWS